MSAKTSTFSGFVCLYSHACNPMIESWIAGQYTGTPISYALFKMELSSSRLEPIWEKKFGYRELIGISLNMDCNFSSKSVKWCSGRKTSYMRLTASCFNSDIILRSPFPYNGEVPLTRLYHEQDWLRCSTRISISLSWSCRLQFVSFPQGP